MALRPAAGARRGGPDVSARVTFPMPGLITALPESRERVLALSALRILRHELYGACPTIKAALADRLEPATDAFLDSAVAAGHPMDWTLHLEYGLYLDLGERACRMEICVAAARRWVRLDDSDTDWIAITDGDVVALGVRTQSPTTGPRIIRGRQPATGATTGFRHQTGTGLPAVRPQDWHAYQMTIRPTPQF